MRIFPKLRVVGDLARVMANRAANGLPEKKSPLLLWKVTNFVYEEEPHPIIRLRCPGLSFESFDRDRNPKLTSLMTLTVMARAAALQRPIRVKTTRESEDEIFLDFTKLTSDHLIFMSSSEYVMSRTMYDNDVPKWPIDMKFIHGFVGNSSVANVCQFFAPNGEDQKEAAAPGQTPLFTNTYQIVLINRETRKPTQLPDWFKEKFKGKGCMDKGFILRPFERPADTFRHPSTVQWTDTDQYNHTNFTTYARWALDALHAALKHKTKASQTNCTDPSSPHTSNPAANGTEEDMDQSVQSKASSSTPGLRGMTPEIVARGLHKMQVCYLRECLEGDSVETHVWQEAGGEDELVLFSVVRDGMDVCQMRMWYFPDDGESLARGSTESPDQ